VEGWSGVNPSSGAIGIGHPFEASGTRYMLALATELPLRATSLRVAGVCAGTGPGIAVVLDNPGAE
jgi:acetyl-CoA acetyltransferase